MMFHHDPMKSYNDAASEAGKKMRAKLHAKIDGARAKATTAFERIQTEIPQDALVRDVAMEVEAVEGVLVAGFGDQKKDIHNWAFGQMCDDMKLPRAFANALRQKVDSQGKRADWGPELVAHTMAEHFKHSADRHLVRYVDEQARGFLSPRYQRRHPGELLDVFIQGCRKFGLLPYDAWCSDTKHGARAVLDGIIEPVKDECLGLGVYYSESPYGNGATELNITVERMWCTNTAVVEQNLRQVHLGRALGDDVAWSEETYRRDTALVGSQIADLLEGSVSESAIKRLEDGVRRANELKIDHNAFEAFLKNAHLGKNEVDGVLAAYRSADVEMMPPGNTVWRASNAISFFAGKVGENPEKAEETFALQKLAGKALMVLAPVAEPAAAPAARKRRR